MLVEIKPEFRSEYPHIAECTFIKGTVRAGIALVTETKTEKCYLILDKELQLKANNWKEGLQ